MRIKKKKTNPHQKAAFLLASFIRKKILRMERLNSNTTVHEEEHGDQCSRLARLHLECCIYFWV